MSVRVVYLERASRGVLIKSVRMVGETADTSWPVLDVDAMGETESIEAVDPQAAAGWIRDQLSQTRTATGVSILCLDLAASSMSCIASPSADPAVVDVIARFGGSLSGGGGGGGGLSGSGSGGLDSAESLRGNSAVEYFAQDPLDSTVQAIDPETNEATKPQRAKVEVKGLLSRLKTGKKDNPQATTSAANERFPIIAMTDVPARLLIDRLDEIGITVETTVSFWHACAMAWDPAWSPTATTEEQTQGGDPLHVSAESSRASVTATIVVDPKGRLIWSWSRAAKLLVGGSMRLRISTPVLAGLEGEPISDDPDAVPHVQFGRDEVTRLATEWLSWAAHLGCIPSRIVCVVPGDDPGMVSEFGSLLTKTWPGAMLDAAMVPDPILATLRRLAERLEQTPKSLNTINSNNSLVSLSTRSGREHRKLYVWIALAIAAVGTLVILATMKMQRSTLEIKARAAGISEDAMNIAKDFFPEARVLPGVSLVESTTQEVARLRNSAEPAKRADPPIPILQELETLSMVVGNPQYAVELIKLEASVNANLDLHIVAETNADADAMKEALNSISGSFVQEWREPEKYDITSRPGKVLVRYRAKWDMPRINEAEEAKLRASKGQADTGALPTVPPVVPGAGGGPTP